VSRKTCPNCEVAEALDCDDRQIRCLGCGWTPHAYNGNCFEGLRSEAEEKKCAEHNRPRGDCNVCERCPPCDRQFSSKAAAAKPADDELFLDIDDDEESLALFSSCVEMMGQKVKLSWNQKPSPSGRSGRIHVTVKMPRPVTPLERIAIQAFMGSDRKSECLSWCRLQGETAK
jgi:hypothetical protein